MSIELPNNLGGQGAIDPRTSLFGNIEGAISEVIRAELTEPQKPIRLSEIKIKRVKQTLKAIEPRLPKSPYTANIVKTLADNADKVKVFFETHGNYYLMHTVSYQQPQVGVDKKTNKVVWANRDLYKGLTKYFEPSSKTFTITQEDAERQRQLYEKRQKEIGDKPNMFNPKPRKVGDTYTYSGYKINDYDGLVNEIKATIPPSDTYGIKDATEQDTFTDLSPVFVDVSEFARGLGIKPQGEIWARRLVDRKTGNRRVVYGIGHIEPNDRTIITEIRASDRLVYFALLLTIVSIKDANEKAQKSKRGIVNIKDASNHDVIMQPHAIGLTDMIDGAFEGREIKNLLKDYRKQGYGNNDEIKKAGGWLAHLEPIQKELPLEFDESDRKTLVKFMTQTKALVIDVTTALGRYLRDNPEHNPDEYISLVALAKYIGRYNDSKLKKGELRPEYRQQILNGLQMAQLISADYIVSKDKKGNKEWRKVYLIDRITDYKTYGNTNTITHLKVDFTKEYKESVGLNLGVILDGVLLLNTPEHKALGAYILERFAQHQDETVKGEPQKMTADTLLKKAGIIDNNKTNKLRTLQKALDAFVENRLIAKWACKNGAKNITGYDRESQTILIYPTENLKNSYAPKSQTQAERKAIRLEQKNRLRTLKEWFKGYTSREQASDDLGVSVAELNELLAGTKIISDDILDTIKEL